MPDTRGVIEGIFAEAARGDLDGVMRWWAPDGVLEDVTLARAFRGHEEIRAYLDMYFGALSDVTYTPQRTVIDGSSAVVEWAQEATLAAPFDGLDCVGRSLYLRAVDIFHIADGLVRHEASWYGDGWLRIRLEGGHAPEPLR
jgi:steroid delta-isomerase-like uncharacterized protein